MLIKINIKTKIFKISLNIKTYRAIFIIKKVPRWYRNCILYYYFLQNLNIDNKYHKGLRALLVKIIKSITMEN